MNAVRVAIEREALALGPDAAEGVEARLVGVDLGSEPVDEDVDDIGLRVEGVVPDVLEDHGLADGAAGVAEQEGEERKFAGLQIDGLAGASDFARDEVEGDVTAGEAGGFGRL